MPATSTWNQESLGAGQACSSGRDQGHEGQPGRVARGWVRARRPGRLAEEGDREGQGDHLQQARSDVGEPDRLGHTRVTLNVYADAIPDDDICAVDTFTKAVWAADPAAVLANR